MSAEATNVLRAVGLRVCAGDRTLIDGLDFELGQGEFVALLGKNGTGKTLLLHTLAGLRDAAAGGVSVGDQALGDISRRALARQLVLMPQHSDDVFPASVLDTVMIGRHPHIDRFGWESSADVQQATEALATMDLEGFAARDILTLSGGERRRVAIAQCLVQDTPLMLLDEPTNHLDPHHQLDALELMRSLADQGRGILLALHDVNFAARYADRCLLLHGDGRWELDDSTSVLTEERLEELYGTAMRAVPWQGTTLFVPELKARNP